MQKNLHPLAATGLMFSLLLPLSISAAPTADQWQAYNEAAIQQHILPRYQQLSQALEQSRVAISRLCTTQDSQALQQAQASYKNAMQQWQAIQHVQFGPVTLMMRNYGLHYWPDKRGTGAGQLRDALLQDNARYDDAFFRSASISLKGFPAQERLLFSDQAETQLQPGQPACQFLLGNSEYLLKTVREIETDWQNQLQHQLNPGSDNPYYGSSAEAAVPLMKSMVEPLQVVLDHKLNYPLGSSYDKARWSRSESWRSNQSVNNLQINLAAMQHLYSGLKPVSVKTLLQDAGAAELATRLDQSFQQLLKQMQAIAEVDQQNLTAATDQQLRQLIPAITELQEQLMQAMASLEIHLGFNSRDGD